MIQHAQQSEQAHQIIIAETLLTARAAHHVFDRLGGRASAAQYFRELQKELKNKPVRFEHAYLPGNLPEQLRREVHPEYLKCYEGLAVFAGSGSISEHARAVLREFVHYQSLSSGVLIYFGENGVTVEQII